jgi:class 3 adenylate cyclase
VGARRPAVAADELRLNGTVTPKRVEHAVVLFADVVGFTAWCGARPPEQVVATLHRLFMDLERISDEHGVEKLKTIGDGFMAARLTSVGTPGRVCLAATIADQLAGRVESVDGGTRFLKGKGDVHVVEVVAVR